VDADRIVEQILSRARIPGAKRRREIERELRDHLEDMAEQGLERFGSPEDVGVALARVYATERLVAQVARLTVMVVASGIAAAVIIGGVQAAMAIWTAAPLAATVAQMGSEVVGFAAVALGFCVSYLARRQFHLSLPGVTGLILVVAVWIGAGLSVLAPRHAVIATVAFLSTAFGGLLAFAPVPLLWLAGTGGPLLIAGIALGPLLPGGGRFPWLMWLGLSLACGALRFIARAFEQHVFTS
jgi:hypothetical protein